MAVTNFISPTQMNAGPKVQKERTEDTRASVDYIGSMSRELALMARAEGCEFLCYLFEMVVIETERIAGVPERHSVS
jgi:hypothetical protein